MPLIPTARTCYENADEEPVLAPYLNDVFPLPLQPPRVPVRAGFAEPFERELDRPVKTRIFALGPTGFIGLENVRQHDGRCEPDLGIAVMKSLFEPYES